MADISLSKAVRTNLMSLQNTATMMSKTQERLATGNKVNSALDNPTNFFTASALNSRAGDMNALLDGMANGIQTLKAADNGLAAITKTVESMQSTLRQARQDKSFQAGTFDVSDESTIKVLGGQFDEETEIKLGTASDGVKAALTSTTAFTGPTAPAAGDASAGAGARTIVDLSSDADVLDSKTIKIDGESITFDGSNGDTAELAAGTITAALQADAATKDKYTVTHGTGADANKLIIERKDDTGPSSTAPVVDLGGAAETYGASKFKYDAERLGSKVSVGCVGGTIKEFGANLQSAIGEDNYKVDVDEVAGEITVTSKIVGSAAPTITRAL